MNYEDESVRLMLGGKPRRSREELERDNAELRAGKCRLNCRTQNRRRTAVSELRYRAEPAHDHKDRRYCDGVKESGYWKGFPCNAFAKFKLGEYEFCGSHFAIYAATLGNRP